MKNTTPILAHFAATTIMAGPFQMAADQVEEYRALTGLGIDLAERDVRAMAAAMDANVLTPTTYAGTLGAPAQFLQTWLPGLVRVITVARRIDEIIGITVAGDWSDEEVVQQVLEPTGSAVPYTDMGNVPLASWNPGYERRTVVRFEQGFQVSTLEAERTSRIPNIDTAAQKRASAALALEILRNRVGFYGYMSGDGRTFGFLNDPQLPAYVSVASNGTTTQWTGKTFLQITADIRAAMGALQTTSGDQIDPERTAMTLVLPTNRAQYFSVTSDFGISVRGWMKETYPLLRVISAPELNAANGGANVFYLFADKVDDESSDGGRTFDQIVPTKLRTLGVEQNVKSYVEDYTNATAGVLLKRPWAVYRGTGI